jgi:hypothetical protein
MLICQLKQLNIEYINYKALREGGEEVAEKEKPSEKLLLQFF